MNEINIYAKYDYHKILKKANILFGKKYKWYSRRSVFAPQDGTFSIAIDKYNIHISYWDDHTEKGKDEKNTLKKFLEENVINMNILLQYDQKCDIITLLKNNNTLI